MTDPRPAALRDDLVRLLRSVRGRFSVWPLDLPVPGGWEPTGFHGPVASCAAYLDERALVAAAERRTPRGPAPAVPRPAGVGGRRPCDGQALEARTRQALSSLDGAGHAPAEPVAVHARSACGRLVAALAVRRHRGVCIPDSADPAVRLVEQDDGRLDAEVVGDARPGPVDAAVVLAEPGDGRSPTLLCVPGTALRAIATAAREWNVGPADRVSWNGPPFSVLDLVQVEVALAAGAYLVPVDGDTAAEVSVAVLPASRLGPAGASGGARLVIALGSVPGPVARRLTARGIDVVELWASSVVGGIVASRRGGGPWRTAHPDATYVLGDDLLPVLRGGVGDAFVGGEVADGGVVGPPGDELGTWFADPVRADGSRMVALGRRAVPTEADGAHAAALTAPRGADVPARP